MMLSVVVVMVVMVLVVVVVESQVTSDSHLYSECVVKKSVDIITFEDSVKFWLARTSNEDLKIKFDQGGGNTFTLQYRNLGQHEWLQAELKLRGVPELYIQGKIHQPIGTSKVIGTRKTFTIEDVDILLECPQGWPNRELSSLGSDVRIPSVGKEESVVLTPTVDTKVNFSVLGNKRILCLNSSSGVAVVDEENESDCGDLKSNSALTLKFLLEDDIVEILDTEGRQLDHFPYQGDRELKFLREGLTGPVYIAQCIGNCTSGTAQDNGGLLTNTTTVTFTEKTGKGTASSLNKECSTCVVYIVLVVVVMVLLLLLSCYVLHLRRQRPSTK